MWLAPLLTRHRRTPHPGHEAAGPGRRLQGPELAKRVSGMGASSQRPRPVPRLLPARPLAAATPASSGCGAKLLNAAISRLGESPAPRASFLQRRRPSGRSRGRRPAARRGGTSERLLELPLPQVSLGERPGRPGGGPRPTHTLSGGNSCVVSEKGVLDQNPNGTHPRLGLQLGSTSTPLPHQHHLEQADLEGPGPPAPHPESASRPHPDLLPAWALPRRSSSP